MFSSSACLGMYITDACVHGGGRMFMLMCCAGRRELGHGELAQRALVPAVPAQVNRHDCCCCCCCRWGCCCIHSGPPTMPAHSGKIPWWLLGWIS